MQLRCSYVACCQCNSVARWGEEKEGAAILNARHAEQEHINIEIKSHLGNQTKRRVKLFGDPFRCHSALYLVLQSQGRTVKKRPNAVFQILNNRESFQQWRSVVAGLQRAVVLNGSFCVKALESCVCSMAATTWGTC